MNLVEAEVRDNQIGFSDIRFPLPEGSDLSAFEGSRVILGIRPSDMEDTAVWPAGDLPTMEARADVTEELGSEVNVIFTVDAPPVVTEDLKAAISDDAGEEPVILAGDEPKCVFVARVDARTTCGPGDVIKLSVDPGRFHFFDPATGRAIDARRAVVAG